MFNVTEIRNDFPILSSRIYGHPLIYLDNAATTQIPQHVLNVITEQYHTYEANVHRGIHYLSSKSTERMERARDITAKFINAHSSEIIFTSGTTASINIIADSICQTLSENDEILVTAMEHHSNLIPWQQAAKRSKAVLRVLPLTENGELQIKDLDMYLTKKTKIFAFCAISNVLGTVNPIQYLISKAHEVGAYTFVDAAQAIRHADIDVKALDCDFLAFSGHKCMGPTGTGILYGKQSLLTFLPPVRFGGGMIDTVYQISSTFGDLPFKFEAGTPNISGNIALGAALEYFTSIKQGAMAHEHKLLSYMEKRLSEIPEVKILGTPSERSGAISFNIDGMQCYDAATLLDKLGIAVRSGNHCAQPLLRFFGLNGILRASPAYYNTFEEIDKFIDGIKKIVKLSKHLSSLS